MNEYKRKRFPLMQELTEKPPLWLL